MSENHDTRSAGALKPCPFCDPLKMGLIGTPKLMAFGEAPGVEHWHGFCVACGAEGPKEATLEAACLAWNRRAGEAELLEACRIALLHAPSIRLAPERRRTVAVLTAAIAKSESR